MTPQEQLTTITHHTKEVLTEKDLKTLISSGTPLQHYIGFEISGRLHIGSGLMSMYKIRDFQEAGVHCRVLLADWHTVLNDKLGGSPKVIKEMAVSYFKEVLIASAKCAGANPDQIEFILGTDFYHHNDQYWQSFVDVSKNLTLARVTKSCTIMGRQEGENQVFARMLYPPMQINDIFSLGVNIAHAGLDQRKAHVIAREVALQLKVNPLIDSQNNQIKPICIHHHLILGLGKPPTWPVKKKNLREVLSAMKMTKSNPKSCVFITDTPDEIRAKITHAFCPPKEVGYNPILDWTKHLLFRETEERELTIKREEQHGGDITVNTYQELERVYQKGDLHPQDLKTAVAQEIIDLLEPARKHFENEKNQNALNRMKELTT